MTMSKLADAVAQGDGGAGLPWAETEMTKVGDTVAGTVISSELRQAINPETKAPAVWERSGEPIMEAVVKVSGTGKFRADLEDGDNGDRAFHIKWAFENKSAFIDAMTAAGVLEPVPGGQFAGQLVGLKQNGGVRKPTKLFRYEYIPPATALAQAVSEPPAEPEQTAAVESLLSAGLGATKVDSAPAVQPQTQPMSSPMAGMTAAQPPAAQTAAPAAQPASQPVSAPAADPQALLAQIKTLIGMGFTDAQITAATGADPVAVTAIRSL